MQGGDIVLDKLLHIGLLYDFYGALLTEKQQECIEMHYVHDLSLSEIANEFGVSRQAVHDILKRAEQLLEEYEHKLKLVERYQLQQLLIQEIYNTINNMDSKVQQLEQIQVVREKLKVLLDCSKEL